MEKSADVRELLAEVLRSEDFAKAPELCRLLEFLVDETFGGDQGAEAKRKINADFVIEKLEPDLKTDYETHQDNVRVKVSRLRGKLNEFFEQDSRGRSLTLRFAVPDTNWRVKITANKPPPRADSVKLFWAPHLRRGEKTILHYAEPLFFKDEGGTYLRHPNINTESDQAASKILSQKLVPSRHFVSAGEVQALIRILEVLHGNGADVSVDESVTSDLERYSKASLVVLGARGVNLLIDSVHREEFEYISTQNGVTGRQPDPVESLGYRDETAFDADKIHELDKYAVLTRCPHINEEHAITMIEAPHGSAIQGVVGFLTKTREVNTLLEMLGGTSFPSCFQVIFRVTLRKQRNGVAVREVGIVKARSYQATVT